MPYSNIVFVKVKMELFEDDRFLIDLNDNQKGLYLMLLALAGKTNNSIRNDVGFIRGRLNLKQLQESDLLRISEVFPKFKLVDNYWQFENFEEEHNYIIGKSKGIPSELQRMYKNKKEKENKKENSKPKRLTAYLTDESFINEIKANPAYKGIDIDVQLGRMDAWLLTKPGRVKTKRFIVNWLNKVDKGVVYGNGVKKSALERLEEIRKHPDYGKK